MTTLMRSKRDVQRSISRGASRHVESRGESVVGRFMLRLLVVIKFLSLLGVVLAAGFATYSYAGQWMQRPVASVSIKGSFNFASRQQLAEQVYAQIDESFMKLDLKQMQNQLETDEWIASAQVARRWPDILEVVVVEHQPIARWSDSKALNQRGELIDIINFDAVEDKLQHLPHLDGPEGMEKTVMLQFQSAMQLFSGRKLTVTSLHVDAAKSWTLVLQNRVEVKVGRHDFMEKLDRFLMVYDKKLKVRWNELSAADLRYFNGVSVRWNDRKLVKKNA